MNTYIDAAKRPTLPIAKDCGEMSRVRRIARKIGLLRRQRESPDGAYARANVGTRGGLAHAKLDEGLRY